MNIIISKSFMIDNFFNFKKKIVYIKILIKKRFKLRSGDWRSSPWNGKLKLDWGAEVEAASVGHDAGANRDVWRVESIPRRTIFWWSLRSMLKNIDVKSEPINSLTSPSFSISTHFMFNHLWMMNAILSSTSFQRRSIVSLSR